MDCEEWIQEMNKIYLALVQLIDHKFENFFLMKGFNSDNWQLIGGQYEDCIRLEKEELQPGSSWRLSENLFHEEKIEVRKARIFILKGVF